MCHSHRLRGGCCTPTRHQVRTDGALVQTEAGYALHLQVVIRGGGQVDTVLGACTFCRCCGSRGGHLGQTEIHPSLLSTARAVCMCLCRAGAALTRVSKDSQSHKLRT